MILHKCPLCGKSEQETEFQMSVLYSKSISFEDGEIVCGDIIERLDLPNDTKKFYCEFCQGEFDTFDIEYID